MRLRGHHLIFLSALLTTAACKDEPVDSVDDSGGDDSSEPDVTLDSVTLSSTSEALYKNQTASLTLTANFSDGSTADVTGEATWSSSDEAVATVAGGEVVAVAAGTADVTAEIEGMSATATVSVEALGLTGLVSLHHWPVADIRVTLSGDATGEVWSDPVDGSFLFEDLGVGTYTVEAWGPNNRTFVEGAVEITLDGATDPGPVVFAFNGFGYPFEDDAYAGDDSPSTASSIGVDGAMQVRSIWPFGTKDWIAVDLTAGVEYEFFTTGLCETCDSYLYLYDTDGETVLTYDDDHVDYDSRAIYTPEADGTYYVMVRPYSEYSGVVNYFFNVLTNVDADADSMGAYHDCDDSNGDINPWAYEIPGSGVDENCDGHVAPSGAEEDWDEETNDEMAGAIPVPLQWNSVEENEYNGHYREMFSRTLHDADDVDWFSVVVPPHGYVYLQNDYYTSDYSYLTYTVYEPDGVTEYSSANYMYASLYNETATEETWYVKVSSYEGSAEIWYDFFAIDYGIDADEDGYYTMDWSSSRDCDDSDASSTDECYP
ncbi:MAG: pre-peptidase C-terminal domain-containing protein [Alphaproteobacteria bacterium]|nr:pre-peptidase C-terminal domain-containing protein [Alphaproteobacteria bacterium]